MCEKGFQHDLDYYANLPYRIVIDPDPEEGGYVARKRHGSKLHWRAGSLSRLRRPFGIKNRKKSLTEKCGRSGTVFSTKSAKTSLEKLSEI